MLNPYFSGSNEYNLFDKEKAEGKQEKHEM